MTNSRKREALKLQQLINEEVGAELKYTQSLRIINSLKEVKDGGMEIELTSPPKTKETNKILNELKAHIDKSNNKEDAIVINSSLSVGSIYKALKKYEYSENTFESIEDLINSVENDGDLKGRNIFIDLNAMTENIDLFINFLKLTMHDNFVTMLIDSSSYYTGVFKDFCYISRSKFDLNVFNVYMLNVDSPIVPLENNIKVYHNYCEMYKSFENLQNILYKTELSGELEAKLCNYWRYEGKLNTVDDFFQKAFIINLKHVNGKDFTMDDKKRYARLIHEGGFDGGENSYVYFRSSEDDSININNEYDLVLAEIGLYKYLNKD